jgi:hypothetical protein
MSPAVERVLCKSAGRRLEAIKSLLTAPIPYLAPLMVGAAPLFFLHWLYQPIVRANPGLRAYKAPVATLMLPPLSQLESAGLAVTPSAASLADVAANFAQPVLQDAKPKVQQSAGNRHLIVSTHNLRTNTPPPAPTRSTKTAINDPGRNTGTQTRRAAYAHAYAQDESGHRRR